MNRTGISRVEVVVALLVVALILALVTPAVLSAREAARFAACQDNLRRLGEAMQSFQQTHGVFPPGRKIHYAHQTIFLTLLPYLGMQSLYDQLDQTWDMTDPKFHALQKEPVAVLQCPSDWASRPSSKSSTKTSYAGNMGTGVQRYGYNGMFRPLGPDEPVSTYRSGPIGPDDVMDGLSTTTALAEWLCGTVETHGSDRLRTVWQTPNYRIEPAQLEEFARECLSIPANPARFGWRRNGDLGVTWLLNSPMDSMYNHILAPGNPSCTNGTKVQEGAYTANSPHAPGVNVLFADGHVECIARDIDQQAWRAIGSRVECDLIFRLDW